MTTATTWPLGSALAIVGRGDRWRVRLQGVVTAMSLELAHRQLAASGADRVDLVLDHDAVLAVTCRSAVDAAIRGSVAGRAADVRVLVPHTRLAWALEYCLLMTRSGLPRTPEVLCRATAEA